MSKHCHHGRRAYECTKCPGKGICDHGRRRSRCILCKQNGAHVAGICTHNRQRHECPDCLKLGKTLQKRAWCNACGSKRLSSEARRAEGLCASCAGLQPKTQDNFIKEVIAKVNHPPTGIDNIVFGGQGCASRHRRPDICWLGVERSIIVECDEDGHPNALVSCELAKITDTAASIKNVMGDLEHVVLVLRVCVRDDDHFDTRVRATARAVEEWRESELEFDKEYSRVLPNVRFLFYSGRCEKHILHCINNPQHVRLVY